MSRAEDLVRRLGEAVGRSLRRFWDDVQTVRRGEGAGNA